MTCDLPATPRITSAREPESNGNGKSKAAAAADQHGSQPIVSAQAALRLHLRGMYKDFKQRSADQDAMNKRNLALRNRLKWVCLRRSPGEEVASKFRESRIVVTHRPNNQLNDKQTRRVQTSDGGANGERRVPKERLNNNDIRISAKNNHRNSDIVNNNNCTNSNSTTSRDNNKNSNNARTTITQSFGGSSKDTQTTTREERAACQALVSTKLSDVRARQQTRLVCDRDKWAKRLGIDNALLFSCSSGFPAIREELLARGWCENNDPNSPHWDIMFVCSWNKLTRERVTRKNQILNRFDRSSVLCSKLGLMNSLRQLKWFESAESSSFFPRCYNLIDKVQDVPDFFNDFWFTHALSILRVCIPEDNILGCSLSTSASPSASMVLKYGWGDFDNDDEIINNNNNNNNNKSVLVAPFVLQTALNVCKRRIRHAFFATEGTHNHKHSSKNNISTSSAYNKVKRQDETNKSECDLELDSKHLYTKPKLSAVELQVLQNTTSHGQMVDSPMKYKTLSACVRAAVEKEELPEEYQVHAARYIAKQLRQYRVALKTGQFEPLEISESGKMEVRHVLKTLCRDPQVQFTLNGKENRNTWIIKPGGKSRGRGIRCSRSVDEIMALANQSAVVNETYVVQKYIESCAVIHGRKFDIRQWVLVTSWKPLTIYFYGDCYLRFCAAKYNSEDLEDKFAHLANNFVAKDSPEFNASPIKGNMWHSDDFINYLGQHQSSKPTSNAKMNTNSNTSTNTNANTKNTNHSQSSPLPQSGIESWTNGIQRSMKEIVKSTLGCVQDVVKARQHSFELFGFDFMVDQSLDRAWLLEVNSSPSMEYSTDVTESLCASALRDLVKCVLNGKYGGGEGRNYEYDRRSEGGGLRLRTPKEQLAVAGAVDTGKWELIFQGGDEAERRVDMLATYGLTVTGSQVRLPKRKKSKKHQ